MRRGWSTRNTFWHAREEARRVGSPHLLCEHVLIGIALDEGPGGRALARVGVDAELLRDEALRARFEALHAEEGGGAPELIHPRVHSGEPGSLPYAAEVGSLLHHALRLSGWTVCRGAMPREKRRATGKWRGERRVDTGHLLLTLLCGTTHAGRVLAAALARRRRSSQELLRAVEFAWSPGPFKALRAGLVALPAGIPALPAHEAAEENALAGPFGPTEALRATLPQPRGPSAEPVLAALRRDAFAGVLEPAQVLGLVVRRLTDDHLVAAVLEWLKLDVNHLCLAADGHYATTQETLARACTLASAEALRTGERSVLPAHLFLGLTRTLPALTGCLRARGVSHERLRSVFSVCRDRALRAG